MSTSTDRIWLDSRITRVIFGLIGFGIAVVVWQLASASGLVSDIIAPPPAEILNALVEQRSIILDNLTVTMWAVTIAYTVSTVGGVLAGGLLSMSDRLQQALMPLIVAGNSVPRVSLAPILLFYFGAAHLAPLLAAWIAFFPMFLSAFQGLAAIDDDIEDLLTALDATTVQEYRYVRIPNAIPYIFDGMRVSLVLAVTGTIVAEFVVTGSGMGYLAFFSSQQLLFPLLFAVVLVMSAITFVLFIALYLVQSRLVYWEETNFFSEA